MKQKILTLMVALAAMLAGFSAKAGIYELEVGDIRVTDENKNNITGECIKGSVVYDSKNKVLTLNNAWITSEYGSGINSHINGLKVVIENDVLLEGLLAGASFWDGQTTVTGNGVNKSRLYVASDTPAAFRVKGTSFTFENLSVEINGSFTGSPSKTMLNVKNSYVKVNSPNETTVSDFKSMTLEGCEITTPAGAVFDEAQRAVVLNGEPATGIVEIRDPKVVPGYPLFIGGVQVTEQNKDKITGSGITGTAAYNPETKVLTLKNATIKAGDAAGIVTNVPYLEILIDGTANIESGTTGVCAGPFLAARTLFNGTGFYESKLNVTSQSGPAISMKNSDLYLENLVVEINGGSGSGITGTGTESLFVKSDLKATAKSDVICNLGQLVLENCDITAPAGAAFDSSLGAVAAGGKTVTGTTVEIKSVHPYGLTVGGVAVIENNKDNITGSGITGTVAYNPETRILTLKDATIETQEEGLSAISNRTGHDLGIKVEGTVDLEAVSSGISSKNNFVIFGSGATGSVMNIKSIDNAGIYINRTDLKIENVTLNVSGYWGLAGNDATKEDVVIKNSNVTATGASGSVCDILSLTLDGCYITAPADAAFDASFGGVVLNGSIVCETVKIETDGSGVEGVTAEQAEDLNAPMFNVMGQQIKQPYNGQIYIQNGKKKIWHE